MQLKKEADYYGDIIILPFIDRYDIVVLKTVAICKFGVCMPIFYFYFFKALCEGICNWIIVLLRLDIS